MSGFEEMSKDIGLKSNIKDVCKLLDLKANTNYVDKILVSYKEDINTRLKLDI